MPGWFYPFGNQAPVCLALSMLACVLGTLAHPAPTPGTEPDPVTFWNSGETLRAGPGASTGTAAWCCGPACHWC